MQKFRNDRRLRIIVPYYRHKNMVTLESIDSNVKIIKIEKNLYDLCFEKETHEFELLFILPEHSNIVRFNRYLIKFILINLTSYNYVPRKAKYQLIDKHGKHIGLEKIPELFTVLFKDDCGNYGIITKNNIRKCLIFIQAEAQEIKILAQSAFNIGCHRLDVVESKCVSTSDCVINIPLVLGKPKYVNVKISAFIFEQCEEDKNKLIALMNKYGVFDIIDVYNDVAIATDLALNTAYQLIELNKPTKVRILPKLKVCDDYLDVFDIIPQTNDEPITISKTEYNLGIVKIYKRFTCQSVLKLFLDSIVDSGKKAPIEDALCEKYGGCKSFEPFERVAYLDKYNKIKVPTSEIYLSLIDVFGNKHFYTHGNHINVGIYELEKIKVLNKKILPNVIEFNHMHVDDGIKYHFNKLEKKCVKDHYNKNECDVDGYCYYYPIKNTFIAVYDKETIIDIFGRLKCIKYDIRVPYTRMYGWYVDVNERSYSNYNYEDWTLDLDAKMIKKDEECEWTSEDDDLDCKEPKIFRRKQYLPIYERVKERRVNNVILAYFNEKEFNGKSKLYLTNNIIRGFIDEIGKCKSTHDFYNNIMYWKDMLNKYNCLLGLSVGGVIDITYYPGQLTEFEGKILQSNQCYVDEFCDAYCSYDNCRYVALIKFILSLHYACNYVEWDVTHCMKYPGYIPFLARVYRNINRCLEVMGLEHRLAYSISLPIEMIATELEIPNNDIGGFPHNFRTLWRKEQYGKLLRSDAYMNPWYINGHTSSLRSGCKSNYFEKYVGLSALTDDDILIDLLNTTDIDDIKQRVSTSLWAHKYEPANTENHFVDENYIYRVSQELSKENRLGLINWKDRMQNDNGAMPSYYDDGFIPLRELPNNNTQIINTFGFRSTELIRLQELIESIEIVRSGRIVVGERLETVYDRFQDAINI